MFIAHRPSRKDTFVAILSLEILLYFTTVAAKYVCCVFRSIMSLLTRHVLSDLMTRRIKNNSRDCQCLCLTLIRGVCKKKNAKMWEFFPSRGPPPPSLTPVWEPHVCEKKIMVYFAFQDLRNIFGFYKNVHFWVVLWFVEVGTGDPTPPLKRKIPTLSRFVIFFLQNEHSGTQNKINLK